MLDVNWKTPLRLVLTIAILYLLRKYSVITDQGGSIFRVFHEHCCSQAEHKFRVLDNEMRKCNYLDSLNNLVQNLRIALADQCVSILDPA